MLNVIVYSSTNKNKPTTPQEKYISVPTKAPHHCRGLMALLLYNFFCCFQEFAQMSLLLEIMTLLSKPSSPLPPRTISSHSTFNLQLCNNPLLLLSDGSRNLPTFTRFAGSNPLQSHEPEVFSETIKLTCPFLLGDRAC